MFILKASNVIIYKRLNSVSVFCMCAATTNYTDTTTTAATTTYYLLLVVANFT